MFSCRLTGRYGCSTRALLGNRLTDRLFILLSMTTYNITTACVSTSNYYIIRNVHKSLKKNRLVYKSVQPRIWITDCLSIIWGDKPCCWSLNVLFFFKFISVFLSKGVSISYWRIFKRLFEQEEICILHYFKGTCLPVPPKKARSGTCSIRVSLRHRPRYEVDDTLVSVSHLRVEYRLLNFGLDTLSNTSPPPPKQTNCPTL